MKTFEFDVVTTKVYKKVAIRAENLAEAKKLVEDCLVNKTVNLEDVAEGDVFEKLKYIGTANPAFVEDYKSTKFFKPAYDENDDDDFDDFFSPILNDEDEVEEDDDTVTSVAESKNGNKIREDGYYTDEERAAAFAPAPKYDATLDPRSIHFDNKKYRELFKRNAIAAQRQNEVSFHHWLYGEKNNTDEEYSRKDCNEAIDGYENSDYSTFQKKKKDKKCGVGDEDCLNEKKKGRLDAAKLAEKFRVKPAKVNESADVKKAKRLAAFRERYIVKKK